MNIHIHIHVPEHLCCFGFVHAEIRDPRCFWNRAGAECKTLVVLGIVHARNARLWSFLESCRRENCENVVAFGIVQVRCEIRDCGRCWNRAGANCETVVVPWTSEKSCFEAASLILSFWVRRSLNWKLQHRAGSSVFKLAALF